MTPAYERAIAELQDLQRLAVNWQHGSALILAGPGSGKTRVLTTRIARIIEESPSHKFRILALTFTNKAADEMSNRVATLCTGADDRTFIGTFHSFCTDVLRQHGNHLGIQNDFSIYSLDEDRREILHDALRGGRGAIPDGVDEDQLLRTIDNLISRFLAPEQTPQVLGTGPQAALHGTAYRLYMEELGRLNALDFNSLLFLTYRLLITYPAIAARYRRTYLYWMIDEFQDTNTAQYRIIKALAGDEFKNLLVVADDDQIIYEWNGASYKQLERFRNDFIPELIQLPTNYRCPSGIVAAANSLVRHNNTRTPQKAPLIAGRTATVLPVADHIRLLTYESDAEEARGVAADIRAKGKTIWGKIVVLARNRTLLEGILNQLKRNDVLAVIAQRRDHFLTPQFRWLQAILRQTVRTLDRRTFRLAIDAYNELTGTVFGADDLISVAEQAAVDYLSVWANTLASRTDGVHSKTAQAIRELRTHPDSYGRVTERLIKEFCTIAEAQEGNDDLTEDCAAWQELKASIAHTIDANAGLEQFLQQLDLRSKEPSPPRGSVRLMTIHAAKGTEADFVYLVGMAEGNIPSFQSTKKGDNSPQMEEERRNCFVAITRAKEQLTLSVAGTYRGWPKQPSRFLREMGLLRTA